LIWSITGYWAYLDPVLISANPRVFLIASGAAMSITTIRLMLAHICKVEFHDPLRSVLFIAPWLLTGANAIFDLKLVPALESLYAAAALGGFILLTYAFLLVDDMAKCLNIKVFTIPHKPVTKVN
jgi:hypothetical protein